MGSFGQTFNSSNSDPLTDRYMALALRTPAMSRSPIPPNVAIEGGTHNRNDYL